jgi:subtilisin-like proprotein convertase family protein
MIPSPRQLLCSFLALLLVATGLGARPVAAGESPGGGSYPIEQVNRRDIDIPEYGAASDYPSTIFIQTPGNISRMRVELRGFFHSFPEDVDVVLVGPGGGSVILMSDAGGKYAVTNVNLAFEDAASLELPTGTWLSSGLYRPANDGGLDPDLFAVPGPSPPYGTALNDFAGKQAAGGWHLFIEDDTPGDGGGINGGWKLSLATCGELSISSPSGGFDSMVPEGAVTLTVAPGDPERRPESVEFFAGADVLIGIDRDGRDGWSITVPRMAAGNYSFGAVMIDERQRRCDVGQVKVTVKRAIPVTSLADSGPGSLRDVVGSAPDPGFVDFAVEGTITLTTGPILITKSLTLIGPGADVLGVSGNDTSPVFEVHAGSTSISGLTIRNGRAEGSAGGPEQNGFAGRGGGIYNQATLSLHHCVVRQNRATGGSGGATDPGLAGNGGRGSGGGIYNAGKLSLTDCVLTSNRATGGSGGGATSGFAGGGGNGWGGGLCSVGGTLDLVRCHIYDCSATGGPGGSATAGGLDSNGGQGYGGGVYTDGLATLRDCTLSGSTAAAGPGPGGVGSGAGGGSSTWRAWNCPTAPSPSTPRPEARLISEGASTTRER